MYLLIDCNNFYVSVERIFQPSLHNYPVVILSNNDGCAIARSDEAKSIGIKMGAPAFTLDPYKKAYNLKVLSSNYPLYADLSKRMIALLKDEGFPLEIYSIDESFIRLPDKYCNIEYLMSLKNKIYQWIGISVSLGLASTKTLAKAANLIAKERTRSKITIFEKTDCSLLKEIDIGDVFGVGKRYAKKLMMMGILTAFDLSQIDLGSLRRIFPVGLARTAAELRGMVCLDLEEEEDIKERKTLTCSRSFGQKLTELKDLEQALSYMIDHATAKLREEKLLAHGLILSIRSSRYDLHDEGIDINELFLTPNATSCTLYWTKRLCELLKKLYKENYRYAKAGVTFIELTSSIQQKIFSEKRVDFESLSLMATIDDINEKFGKKSIQLASSIGSNNWHPKAKSKSQRFTTSWDELMIVKAK